MQFPAPCFSSAKVGTAQKRGLITHTHTPNLGLFQHVGHLFVFFPGISWSKQGERIVVVRVDLPKKEQKNKEGLRDGNEQGETALIDSCLK